MKETNQLSKCCKAKAKINMSKDFLGDNPKKMIIGTCHYVCTKCKQACDIYSEEIKEEKFTPGPWKYEKCSCGHPACNKYVIKHSSANGMFEIADAKLIVETPELLEACKIALEWLTDRKNCRVETLFDVTEKLNDTIKKAEG